METEKPKSKYAAKVAARAKRATVGAVIASLERGESVQPKTEQVKRKAEKAKTPPPPPRDKIVPLGNLPEQLSDELMTAERTLSLARELAERIYNMANPGIQRAEPLAIIGAIDAMTFKLPGLANRAYRIRNTKQEGAKE